MVVQITFVDFTGVFAKLKYVHTGVPLWNLKLKDIANMHLHAKFYRDISVANVLFFGLFTNFVKYAYIKWNRTFYYIGDYLHDCYWNTYSIY